ncbi:MAG TPA: TetR/AcrR family transcriptional regulator [Streptosporangiaceae bacterium]
MNAPRTARDRARAELTRDIKDVARALIERDGAAALSLREVSREMGMGASSLYRYFASRDDLLTALIIDAFDQIGAAAEEADAGARRAGAGYGARWLAAGRAVRGWALAHPHEFALVYGSPVSGYTAPPDTVGPATRITGVLGGILSEAVAAGDLMPPARPLPGPRLVPERILLAYGPPPAPYQDAIERALVLWIALIGTISFELFGHLKDTVTDYAAYFDAAVRIAAECAGLDVPAGPDVPAARPSHPKRGR